MHLKRYPLKYRGSLALLAIVGCGLYLFSRSPSIPPAAQLRGAALASWFLIGIAAASGLAAMATVQFWKVLFKPRARFHSIELKRALGPGSTQVLGLAAPSSRHHYKTAWGASPRAFEYLLDSSSEILMGQVRSAADYILLRPKGFESALFGIAGESGFAAVERYLELLSRRHAQNPDFDPDPPEGMPKAPKEKEVGRTELNEALVAVRFFVDQYLNLVHISIREQWKRHVRAVAVAAAGSTGLLVLFLSELAPATKAVTVFVALVWGGFFSWLLRDFVALVERRRT